AHVTGDTFSGNFPTTADAFDKTLGGGQDAFVSKLAPNGQSLAYSTYLGGSDVEDVFGIAVDSAGAAYVTGATFSADFPTTAGALDTTRGGSSDAFVSKIGGPQPASISGTVYNDKNGNGHRDVGEPGLQGVTVYLDSNNNSAPNAGEPSAV